MYTEVPLTYEFINHILTFGLDIRWRKKAARIVAQFGGTQWLDIGIGTGDMAMNLCRLAPVGTEVSALDFSLPMIQEAVRKRLAKDMNPVLGEGTGLPFKDNTFDAVTISFASRNIDSSGEGNLLECLAETHRILKPGGVFVNLETSQPRHRFIRWFFHLYVKLTVYPIGSTISGSRSAYMYLSRSMRKFYSAEDLLEIIRQAGFQSVSFNRLLFGTAAIHIARK